MIYEENVQSRTFFRARILSGFVCLLISLCFLTVPMRVKAESPFSLDLSLLSGADSDHFEIQVTIGNSGENFDGIVRLTVEENYKIPDVYDTVISLPADSTKQFAVNVPLASLNDDYSGSITIQILDKKQQELLFQKYKDFLLNETNTLAMGILSDNYSALTFMDLGGDRIYFFGESYPIKLMELTNSNVKSSLDFITLLVIDQYDTSFLTDEDITAIIEWVDNGGVLIMGTGSAGEKTLKGFPEDFIGMEASYSAEDNFFPSNLSLSAQSAQELPLATLQVKNFTWNDNYYISGYSRSYGDGSCSVFPYSLAEIGALDPQSFESKDPDFFFNTLIENVCSNSNKRYYSQNNYRDFTYLTARYFGVLCNSLNVLHFGILKVLIVLYVIIVGPVLYLILRALKKQELYWAVVPLSAFFMIFIVYLAGRGFEITNTKAYTVSVAEAAGKGTQKTYILCYNASRREWSAKLDDTYQYAGPLLDGKYSNGSSGSTEYFRRIQKEGETYSIGLKPSSPFENAYFLGVRQNSESGTISIDKEIDSLNSFNALSGRITNHTGKNFLYFAVVYDNAIFVYKDFPAETSCDLNTKAMLQGNYYSSYNTMNTVSVFLRTAVRPAFQDKNGEDPAALSALGIGMSTTCLGDANYIIGVAETDEKAIHDSCSETSYACCYISF